MKELFEKWLLEEKRMKSPASASNYVGSLENLTRQMLDKPKTSVWPGIFEYLIGHAPVKGPYEVSSLAEFNDVYGEFTPLITNDEKVYGNFDHAKYDECYDFTHLTDKGDHRRMLNAYRDYLKFLEWHDKGGSAKEDILFSVRVGKSLLKYGMTLPNAVVDSLRTEIGPIKLGGSIPVTILLDGKEYALKITNCNFNRERYPRHSEIWRVLWQGNSGIKARLRNIFADSYQRLGLDEGLEVVDEVEDKKLTDERIDFYRAESALVWTAKCCTKKGGGDMKIKQVKDLDDKDVKKFAKFVKDKGLSYSSALIRRFVAALKTKNFVVLTGLSGSGKTQLALSFCEWFANDRKLLVPVGADWTNNEKLLGYVDAMHENKYVRPETGILTHVLAAAKSKAPYFLILDEMNLSHVERYFADFLSAMESKDELKLHGGTEILDGVPPAVKIPENLWVIGTMNVDETTYMFSPKVLDRAQVIEFRVSEEEMSIYLMDKKEAGAALCDCFPKLAEVGAEFGYRTANEFVKYVEEAQKLGCKIDEAIDTAIMQKLLPKVHGARKQLSPVLKAMWNITLKDDSVRKQEVCKLENAAKAPSFDYTTNCRYSLSAAKILRMYKNAEANGFASYAEA